jgi:RimJ/RimL family protein N-acetyltransferase
MPRLETPRLLVRPLQASDVEALVEIWGDPEVMRHMGGPRDHEKVRQALEGELRTNSSDLLGFCSVVEKASGRLIGDCGLTKKEVDGRDEVELVYLFAADSWGKGYATEAASAMRDYALGSLRLRRLIALVDPENVASARVAEKVGMHFEKEVIRPGGAQRRVYALQARSS